MLALVAEDNRPMAEFLGTGLQQENCTVGVVEDVDVIRHLRSRKVNTPIISLRAREDVKDSEAGLDLGADERSRPDL